MSVIRFVHLTLQLRLIISLKPNCMKPKQVYSIHPLLLTDVSTEVLTAAVVVGEGSH